jgi:threonine/homoserine/homoserine lactone efflux protein
MSHLLSVIPLALVMVCGPQIVSAIFLATSEHWGRSSASFLGGAAVSVTLVITIVYVITRLAGRSGDGSHHGSAQKWTDIGVAVLLLIFAVIVSRRRKKSEPPRWMGKLENATAWRSLTLGLLLLGVFPSDLVMSIAVGSHLAAHRDPWWHVLVFALVVVLLLALPALLTLVLGNRAQQVLPKVRDWMNANSWIVSEVVIAFFLAIIIAGLVGS